jgi:hypothetical protein
MPLYKYRLRASGPGGERYRTPKTDSADEDLAVTLPDSPW